MGTDEDLERDARLRQAGSASPAAQSWLGGQQDGEMRTCSPSYFPPSAQSRATGHWVVPSHMPSPGEILLRVLVGRKGHTRTTERGLSEMDS